jgi:N-methylhydantoinase A
MDADAVAAASIKLVNLQMAKAVHIVSLERGLDPRGFTLVSFGGAGPMHAAELAHEAGIDRVIIPPWPGLFSALSMLLSDAKYAYVKGILASLDELPDENIEQSFLAMTREALEQLRHREIGVSNASIIRSLDLRYAGQGYEIEISVPQPFRSSEAVRRFVDKHEAMYGYRQSGEKLEVTALRLTILLPIAKAKLTNQHQTHISTHRSHHREVWFEDEWSDAIVFQREDLSRGGGVNGPAIIEEYDSTVVVPPRWNCELGSASCLVLKRTH